MKIIRPMGFINHPMNCMNFPYLSTNLRGIKAWSPVGSAWQAAPPPVEVAGMRYVAEKDCWMPCPAMQSVRLEELKVPASRVFFVGGTGEGGPWLSRVSVLFFKTWAVLGGWLQRLCLLDIHMFFEYPSGEYPNETPVRWALETANWDELCRDPGHPWPPRFSLWMFSLSSTVTWRRTCRSGANHRMGWEHG